MTGPEHYQRAEQLLDLAGEEPTDPDAPYAHERYLLAKAQVHAMLAQTALSVDALDSSRALTTLVGAEWASAIGRGAS
jgi:hypothetical protein